MTSSSPSIAMDSAITYHRNPASGFEPNIKTRQDTPAPRQIKSRLRQKKVKQCISSTIQCVMIAFFAMVLFIFFAYLFIVRNKMEDFNHNSTFTNSSLKDTTSTPMNTIIVQKDEKRNVPTQHMSQILIDQLHNNLSDINWNLADTRKYCTEGSSIFNCQLNWTMIGSHIDVKAIQMDVTTNTTEEHCFTINSFITCFHPFNGTHHEIFTYKLLYKNGTLDLESIPNYTFYPNYLLALTPQDFLLIFKAENIHNLADCCILSLYEDKCKSFDQLKKQKNIIT